MPSVFCQGVTRHHTQGSHYLSIQVHLIACDAEAKHLLLQAQFLGEAEVLHIGHVDAQSAATEDAGSTHVVDEVAQSQLDGSEGVLSGECRVLSLLAPGFADRDEGG